MNLSFTPIGHVRNAIREPRRPNGIGVTTVRLQKVERNKVWVSGLDAMDGTPILDIKPGSMPPTTQTAEAETLRRERLRNNPRFDVIRAIKSEDLEELLLGAAQMHGHFCPGLALGVKATRDRAFAVLQLPFDQLFTMKEVAG